MQKPVLIDVTRLLLRIIKGKNATGVDRVCLAYIDYFSKNAQAILAWKSKVTVLDKKTSEQLFHLLLNNPKQKSRNFWIHTLVKSMFLTPNHLGNYEGCFYFNINHKGLEYEEYINKILRLKLIPIFFIHDLIPITHPEFCRAAEKDLHVKRMLNVLRADGGILVNSAFTQQQLAAFAEQNQMALPPTEVAWLSCKFLTQQSQSQPDEDFIKNLGQNYFVMLSTIEPRKNHLTILHIWRELFEKYKAQTPKLVLIGQRGWECEQVIDLLERSPAIRQCLVEIPSASDSRIVDVLKNARALLFPSYVEGYGLPLVEALYLGVPVLASDIEVFNEIGQQIPEFIHPIDGVSWMSYIEDYMQPTSEKRALQLKRLAHYQHWEWLQHFECVDALMQKLEQAKK